MSKTTNGIHFGDTESKQIKKYVPSSEVDAPSGFWDVCASYAEVASAPELGQT